MELLFEILITAIPHVRRRLIKSVILNFPTGVVFTNVWQVKKCGNLTAAAYLFPYKLVYKLCTDYCSQKFVQNSSMHELNKHTYSCSYASL